MQYNWPITLSTWESILGLRRSLFHYSDTSPMDATSILQGTLWFCLFSYLCVIDYLFMSKTNFSPLSLCSHDGGQLQLCSLSILESNSCLVKVVLQSLNAHKEGFEHLSHIMWFGKSKQKVFQLKSGSDDWVKWYKTGELGWESVFTVNTWRGKVGLVQGKSGFCMASKTRRGASRCCQQKVRAPPPRLLLISCLPPINIWEDTLPQKVSSPWKTKAPLFLGLKSKKSCRPQRVWSHANSLRLD